MRYYDPEYEIIRNRPEQFSKTTNFFKYVLYSIPAFLLIWTLVDFRGEALDQTSVHTTLQQSNALTMDSSIDYGDYFKRAVETWTSSLIDDDLPTPKFTGHGSGKGTFNCDDYPTWDPITCAATEEFLSNIINLNYKRLGDYLLNLAKDPLHTENTIDHTSGYLGSFAAQTTELFLERWDASWERFPYFLRDFGGGAGAGFQIMCQGRTLFSAGGGGGGGFEINENGTYTWQAGGGGGVQIYDPTNDFAEISIGGGHGVPKYAGVMDANATPQKFYDTWPMVLNRIKSCRPSELHLHGGGGGGAGLSIEDVSDTYLHQYFYFYFEFGDDGPRADAEEAAQSNSGKPVDFCSNIPDDSPQKVQCEKARTASDKDAANSKEIVSAPKTAPASS